VKTEISAYKEIIRVLQEELHKNELINNTKPSQQDYSDDCSKPQQIKDATIKNYKRNYDFNSNLIQIISTTPNR
jgi:hypothetical protein